MTDELARLRAVMEAARADLSHSGSSQLFGGSRKAAAALGTLWPALLAVVEDYGKATPGHHLSCCHGRWRSGKRNGCLSSCRGYKLRAAIREHLGDP